MNLQTILIEKKKAIVQKWIDQVLDTYASPGFFKKQKDRFANPIGATISDGLEKLYDILLEDTDLSSASAPLEDIVKIRAVQDFTPSQAVSFIYVFKTIVREELARAKDKAQFQESLSVLEARIDALAGLW